ncbi:hypothetical protein OAL10_11260 [Gammaproteobacteria bacterium]|nr:hypothetical protein [Gammaproteobacteria bacterium]
MKFLLPNQDGNMMSKLLQVSTKIILILSTVLFVQGCVSTAAGVQATFVDPAQFKDLSCTDLVAGKNQRQNALAALSDKQDNARSRAIAYNLLLVVGSGALVKDRSDQIGVVKGEIAAIESTIAQSCGSGA